jgi:hypothetical protein
MRGRFPCRPGPKQHGEEATPPRSKTSVDRDMIEHEQALPKGLGLVLSAREFWVQMERWHVPDDVALELIQFPGKLGKSGKRPRFRFTTRQRRITSYLPEIDAALVAAGKDQGWLHRKIQAPRSLDTHRSNSW